MAKNAKQQAAIAMSIKATGKKPKAKMGGAKNCWPGYTKKGTKMLNGKVVNNCVKSK